MKKNQVPILFISGIINYKSVFITISTNKLIFCKEREENSIHQSSIYLKMYQLSPTGDSVDLSFLALQTLISLSVNTFLLGQPWREPENNVQSYLISDFYFVGT